MRRRALSIVTYSKPRRRLSVAAWHDPAVRSHGTAFRVFMAVYVAAMLGVILIVIHGLWTEVLAAWPK